MQLPGSSLYAFLVAFIDCTYGMASLRLQVSSAERSCARGDIGLINTSIQIQARFTQASSATDWTTLVAVDPKQGFNGTLDIHYNSADGVQLRLLQSEHGGGDCNCWMVKDAAIVMGNTEQSLINRTFIFNGIDFITVLSINSCSLENGNEALFCQGTATEARGFISQAVQLPLSETATGTCPGNSNTLIEAKGRSLPAVCSILRIEVSYSLAIHVGEHCPGPVGEEESIEFSMRTELSDIWIPLMLTERKESGQSDTTERVVRGYDVTVRRLSNTNTEMHQVTICGETLLPANASEVQFRWINTVSGTPKVWLIPMATADYIYSNIHTSRIFNSIDDSTSPWQAIRNGGINCTICDGALPCSLTYFGNSPDSAGLQSNIALTNAVIIPSVSTPSAETSTTETSTDAPSAETSTGAPSAETTTGAPSVETSTGAPSAETSTGAPSAETTTGASSVETTTGALSAETTTDAPSVETSTGAPSAEISSLSSVMILNMLSSSLHEYNLLNYDLKLILDALEVVIDKGHNTTEVPPDVIGSSLLSFVDRLALVAFQVEDNITSTNGQIFIQTRLISADVENYITTINSKDYSDNLPLMSIEIPSELVRVFAGSISGGDERVVRVISALYYNVEHLFPGERPGEKSSALGSGIVSTALQCGESLCDTTEISLSYPVVITFEHIFLESNVVSECVFWKFLTLSANTSLTSGKWSNEGCFVNAALSNNSFTVCECYHLTHFAILLSPVPVKYDQDVEFSLQVIGYIGVAVSVVAMVITAITFISLKSLHNIRSYIHIHLCINLMIAQLIFVVGIDKSAEDHVPVHCQVIAVLLHYFFLVSFMWMLMEGVVLYFILIRVFVTNTKKYIIGFTLASYGIPFLYVGLLTLPLGYTLKTQHYGSNLVCFLNSETHFIWAFIAPVMLIILLNIGFLIMAAVALWRQKKSQKGEMDRRSIVTWLKTVGFLVVVMGITWIVGVVVMEVDALLPLAYIFTIMVAFQGVAIFLSLVAFQKPVRDEYIKWLKGQKISKYFAKSSTDTSTSSALVKRNENFQSLDAIEASEEQKIDKKKEKSTTRDDNV